MKYRYTVISTFDIYLDNPLLISVNVFVVVVLFYSSLNRPHKCEKNGSTFGFLVQN